MAEPSKRPVSGFRGQHLGLAIAATALLAVVAAGLATYTWPPGAGDAQTFDVGSLDDFPRGSVTSYVRAGSSIREYDPGRGDAEYPTFHVVRLEDGETLALLARLPHPIATGATWRPGMTFNGLTGVFRDGPTGSTYDMTGRRVFGPAPRDLDRAALRIEGGRVIVDLAVVTEGEWRVERISHERATPAATATPWPTEPAREGN